MSTEGGLTVAGPVLDGQVARRLLCFEVSRLLVARKVTHAQAGAWLGVSRASFSQAVAGKNLLSMPALEVLLGRLGAEQSSARLLHLHKLARKSSPLATGRGPELLIGVEACASRIELYDVARFGGLITGDRSRVLGGGGGPELVWMVEEHLARRPLPADVRERVRRVVGLPNVTIQVVPYGVDRQLALSGGFEVVHGPAGVVVCEEGRRSHHYFDADAAVADYRAVFAALRGAAYSPDRSRALLV
jgi:hypothetical protein